MPIYIYIIKVTTHHTRRNPYPTVNYYVYE